MGEYVRPGDERLAWISGFTGSAGYAVISRNEAQLYVDSRYTLQAAQECPEFEIVEWPETNFWEKLANQNIGFDPTLVTIKEYENWQYHAAQSQNKLIPVSYNLIDQIWNDRPKSKGSKIRSLPQSVSGRSSASKISQLIEKLTISKAHAYLSANPTEIAWLLNIRGGELEKVPAPHVCALFETNGQVSIFGDVQFDHDLKINFLSFADGYAHLRALNDTVAIDPQKTPYVFQQITQNLIEIENPVALEIAKKNPSEIAASVSAHIQDACAVVEFWHWLENQEQNRLDELTIIDRLWSFRKKRGAKAPSFDTIAGFNKNGAIVHYVADHKSNLQFTTNGILLLDSGAHYEGATTDITRTFAIQGGLKEAHLPFTAVLNGLAQISQARFPKGLAGRDIDALAREPLWQKGWDYGHGTGHGVGAELSVHEGPQSISKRSNTSLEDSMILSLEPGYYQENAFGIRLENLVVVKENQKFMKFSALTFVPFDTRLIDKKSLRPQTKSWLNDYHKNCYEQLASHLEDDVRKFFKKLCVAI